MEDIIAELPHLANTDVVRVELQLYRQCSSLFATSTYAHMSAVVGLLVGLASPSVSCRRRSTTRQQTPKAECTHSHWHAFRHCIYKYQPPSCVQAFDFDDGMDFTLLAPSQNASVALTELLLTQGCETLPMDNFARVRPDTHIK